MIPCLVIGDSIAVGVGSNLPECKTEARIGITSARYLEVFATYKTQSGSVIISLGVNDGDVDHKHTYENLKNIREHIPKSTEVVWIIPGAHPSTIKEILTLAKEFGDKTINISPYVGRDGIHPTGAGYKDIANSLRKM